MIAMNGDVVAFLRLTFAMALASACAEIGLLDGVRGFEKGNRRATCSKWRGPDRKFGKALREVARPAGLEPATSWFVARTRSKLNCSRPCKIWVCCHPSWRPVAPCKRVFWNFLRVVASGVGRES